MKKLKLISYSLLLTIMLTSVGCACIDPLEPMNRKIFVFNMALDHAIFRPVAKAYDKIVPAPVVCAIGNFFDNIDDITNVANNALQLKFYDAWSDVWRVGFNTTFGLLGLFDVATCAGLPKHHQDFGLTLARYGYVRSTYLMIPLFGPATIRDTVGWGVDWRYLSVWPYIEPKSLRYGLYGLRLVHKRALLLPADKLIDESVDPYIFVRDAYLQKRNCDIKCVREGINAPKIEFQEQDSSGKPITAPAKDKDDTYVPDDGDDAKDKDDPFVADGDDKPDQTKKDGVASNSSKAKNDGDTFVEP